MEGLVRRSPVSFDARPEKTEMRDNWNVVLEYKAEETWPSVVDLSHRARWDLQDADIARIQPWGIRIPDAPGQCVFENGILINRMNRTQASIWHLFGETPPAPDDLAFTDVRDTTVFLALIGKGIFSLAEKLTSLDFLRSSDNQFFLTDINCTPNFNYMKDGHKIVAGLNQCPENPLPSPCSGVQCHEHTC